MARLRVGWSHLESVERLVILQTKLEDVQDVAVIHASEGEVVWPLLGMRT